MWGGLKVAARPPDESHPYGHGKAEPIAAIAGSVSILVAALLLSVESVREILTPHHAPAPFTLLVLIVVVAIKEGLFRVVSNFWKNVAQHCAEDGGDASSKRCAHFGRCIRRHLDRVDRKKKWIRLGKRG